MNKLKQLGINIRNIRRGRKLTQIDLAIKTNIPRSYLSAIEHGKANITLSTISKLEIALDCTLIII